MQRAGRGVGAPPQVTKACRGLLSSRAQTLVAEALVLLPAEKEFTCSELSTNPRLLKAGAESGGGGFHIPHLKGLEQECVITNWTSGSKKAKLSFTTTTHRLEGDEGRGEGARG